MLLAEQSALNIYSSVVSAVRGMISVDPLSTDKSALILNIQLSSIGMSRTRGDHEPTGATSSRRECQYNHLHRLFPRVAGSNRGVSFGGAVASKSEVAAAVSLSPSLFHVCHWWWIESRIHSLVPFLAVLSRILLAPPHPSFYWCRFCVASHPYI